MKTPELFQLMEQIGQRARAASRVLARADSARKNKALNTIAATIRSSADRLSAENAKDLDAARKAGHDEAFVDRLALTRQGIEAMAAGLEQIAGLPDPIGEISNMRFRPSGIQVGQMRVPLG